MGLHVFVYKPSMIHVQHSMLVVTHYTTDQPRGLKGVMGLFFQFPANVCTC